LRHEEREGWPAAGGDKKRYLNLTEGMMTQATHGSSEERWGGGATKKRLRAEEQQVVTVRATPFINLFFPVKAGTGPGITTGRGS